MRCWVDRFRAAGGGSGGIGGFGCDRGGAAVDALAVSASASWLTWCGSVNVGEATRFRLEKPSIVSCRFLGSTVLVTAESAAVAAAVIAPSSSPCTVTDPPPCACCALDAARGAALKKPVIAVCPPAAIRFRLTFFHRPKLARME